MLNRLRYRRLRTRLSLLAITALLWSQMLLALHADCASLLMSGSAVAVSVEHEDCSEADSGPDLVVCQSHCSQGEGSPDAPRATLSVPAMPPAAGVGITAVLRVAIPPTEDASSLAAAAWHRPTPHPASILLIWAGPPSPDADALGRSGTPRGAPRAVAVDREPLGFALRARNLS